MWVCVVKDNEEMHIIPVADLIDHTEDEECVCVPQITDLGEGQCMYTHVSLDGREKNEPDWKG